MCHKYYIGLVRELAVEFKFQLLFAFLLVNVDQMHTKEKNSACLTLAQRF